MQCYRRVSNFPKESHNSQFSRPTEIRRMSDNAKRKITKTPAEHPKYEEMIKIAIRTLKERNGSSRQAIEKYVKANFKVRDTATRHIKTALKKGAANGVFVHTKGAGASGSFKLPKEQKKPAKKPAATSKKPVSKPEKPAAATKVSTKKPAATEKEISSKKISSRKKPSSEKATSKKPAVQKTSGAKSERKPKVAAKKPNTKKEVKKPAAAKKAKLAKKK